VSTTTTRRGASDTAGARSVLSRPLMSYYLLLGSTLMLTALGLVMVLSASSVTSYAQSGSSFGYVEKQGMWVAVGLPLMWWCARRPVRFWRMLAYPALIGSFFLLCLVLVPGLGVRINGNQNWINFGGPFRLQPSEAAKLALVLWASDLMTRKERLLGQWKHLLVPLLPVAGGMLALVLLGGDLGTTLLLLGILMSLLFYAGAPLRLFVGMVGVAVALVALMTTTHSARMQRLTSFTNPFKDFHGAGWQAAHGIFALATGGWWGLGLGASREKWEYLPEAHTDFIFAIIGEELGMVGTLVVLGLFAAIGYSGIRIATRNADPFVRLAAGGMTAWIMVQAVVNVGAVLGMLPITGVPLPLVSYGGSALLPIMVGIGMLLSFARREPGAVEALEARGPGLLRRTTARLTGRSH
jgi:cell division protein FtsW